MAERNVVVEAGLHRAWGNEGPATPEKLVPSQGAIEVFEMARDLRELTGDDKQKALNSLEVYATRRLGKRRIGGKVCSNFADLDSLVADVDSGRYVVPNKEKTEYEDLYHLWGDMVDGFTLASIFQPGVEDDLRAAMGKDVDDKPGAVEEVLGIDSDKKSVLVGIGKVVVDTAITDDRLLNRLKSLQRRVAGGNGGYEVYDGEYTKIEEMIDGGEVDEREAEMILAYLSSIMGGINKQTEAMQAAQVASYTRQEAYADRQLRLQEQAEGTTYADWLGTIIGKSGQAGLPGAIWTLEPPEYFKGSGMEWNEFLAKVTSWHGKVMSRRAIYSDSRDVGKAYFSKSFPELQERDLVEVLEDPRLHFEDVLKFVINDLYVEAITDPDGRIRVLTDDEKLNGKKRGLFVFKAGSKEKRDGDKIIGVREEDKEGALVMVSKETGRRSYLLRVAERFKDMLGSEDYAKMVASLALDFLELGGGMESPDRQRDLTFVPEGVRTSCRPGYKFGQKTEGGEVFAGAWSAYYRERWGDEIKIEIEARRRSAELRGITWDEKMEMDVSNKVIADMARKDGLIPQVLCGSILDLDFTYTTSNGEKEKMALGRFLGEGIKLPLSSQSTNDILFSYKKWLENACAFWGYTSSSVKLDFKGGIKEVDSIITEFAKDLNNAWVDLTQRPCGITKDHLVGAIGGAAGVIPSIPMILNVPMGRNYPYMFTGNSLMDHMPGLSQDVRDYLMEKFGFDSKFAASVPDLWQMAHNVRFSEEDRAVYRDVMLNRGGSKARRLRKIMRG